MGEVTIGLGFARAVRPEAVHVRETLDPGAVAATEVPDGRGIGLPPGSGRAEGGAAPRGFAPPLAPSAAVGRVRLVLDTDRLAGWNEIDAIELVGDGLRPWAQEVTASRSYAGS